MATKAAGALPVCLVGLLGIVGAHPAHADDRGTTVYDGVNRLRPCAPLSYDPRLSAAAQRHADDMLRNGVDGHTGSDGSSPQGRIADAGYGQTAGSGEIVDWGTGALATPAAALDLWMKSPGHRSIIVNCAFTAGGFATASDGNKMTAVGDFTAS
ncbi:MAG: CAP domain-containing protein [Mycobacteriaceae bacterium]|nr:CAP domain-containing protein [Mycobacteriaceae bacterium]